MKQQRAFSLVEILFVLAIIGVLIFSSKDLYRRFLGLSIKKDQLETAAREPFTAVPTWSVYKNFPAFIEKHKQALGAWRKLSYEERDSILGEMQASFPQAPATQKNGGIYPWSIMSDESGNAILAGGLVLSVMSTPILIVKNDGQIVSINTVNAFDPAQYSNPYDLKLPKFLTMKAWLWHRKDKQHVIFIGERISDPNVRRIVTYEKFVTRDIKNAVLLLDGEEVVSSLENKRSMPSDGSAMQTVEYIGFVGLPDPLKPKELFKYELSGFWYKDFYGQNKYKNALGSGELVELSEWR